MSTRWTRVTRKAPCPICQKPDWCTIGERGVCCMRIQSPKPMRNGGFFHATARMDDLRPFRPARPTPTLRQAADLLARWQASTTPAQIKTLAGDLGVTMAALEALGAAWAAPREAWAFPMRDGTGKVVGIRLRSASRKWAVAGSAEGLFYPAGDFAPGTALVCEGPTDCAAALSLGFSAVGRPSCTGGVHQLRALFARAGIHRAIIIADNDTPGRTGATRMADALDLPHKILALPAKDLRDFVRAGATAALLREMLRWQSWSERGGTIGGRESSLPVAQEKTPSCQPAPNVKGERHGHLLPV